MTISDKYLSQFAKEKLNSFFRCLECGKNSEFQEIHEDEFGTLICTKCHSDKGFKEVIFGTPPAHKVAEWERNRRLNPYVMPEWKKSVLDKIKGLSKRLLASGLAIENLQAISKANCGVSRFEHLQYCSDVVLDRLIGELEGMA